MTPLALEMLIHFNHKAHPFIDRPFCEWPVAQQAIVNSFLKRGLIATTARNGVFRLTFNGKMAFNRVISTFKVVVEETTNVETSEHEI